MKGIVWKSPRYDPDAYRVHQLMKGLFFRNKGKVKCSVCKYFLCSCQVNLLDWVVVKKPLKDLTHNEKIANCPNNCVNSTKECLNCYNFDNFKMVVRL